MCTCIENACGESPPPLAIGDLWQELQTEACAAKWIQKSNKLGSRSCQNEAKMKQIGVQNQ